MAEYQITEQDFVDASYFALRTPRRLMYAIVLLAPVAIPIAGGLTAEVLRLRDLFTLP